MHRTLWLSLVVAFLAAFSSAFSFDDLNIDGIEAYIHQGQKRQASGTGNSQPPPQSSSPPPPPPSSSKAPASTPKNTPSQPASSEQSSAPQSTPAPSSANSKPASSTPPPSTPAPSSPRTAASVFTSELVSTSVSEFTSVFITSSDGVAVTLTSVFSSNVPITTQALYTEAPTSPNGGSSGSGLTQTNKNIIGGVVGGVGGALLLGGIALVFLRMRKRQARVHEDDDDMTLGTGSALGDKHVHGTTPFQSNLEQYHNPGGRPNAAANF